jgi:hypothetical protein
MMDTPPIRSTILVRQGHAFLRIKRSSTEGLPRIIDCSELEGTGNFERRLG